MGKFNSSYKTAMGKSVSHAWIALHRCVEANARLTGEGFCAIFARLEVEFSFMRTEKESFPNLYQIQEAAMLLKKERKMFVDELKMLEQERKIEKKEGKRKNNIRRLKQICEKQSKHKIPSLGFWGWRKIREANN